MKERDRERMKRQIYAVFTNLEKLKEKGIWFGEPSNSEYMSWYPNGNKQLHYIKNKTWPGMGRCGEFKYWNRDGKLTDWSFIMLDDEIDLLKNPKNLEYARKNDQGNPWLKIDL